MKNETTYNQIDNYLRGTLSDAEVLSIESRIKDDPHFAEYVENHSLANEVIMQAELMSIKSDLSEIHAREGGKSWFQKNIISVLALSLLLFFGVLVYTFSDVKSTVDFAEKEAETVESKNVQEDKSINNIVAEVKERSTEAQAESDKIILIDESKTSLNNQEGSPNLSDEEYELDTVFTNVNAESTSIERSDPSGKPISVPVKEVDDGNQAPAVIECEDYIVDIEFNTKPSCQAKKTGEFEVLLDERYNDYLLSTSNGSPQKSRLFKGVSPGYSEVFLIDKRGCNSQPVSVYIESMMCDIVMYPERGIYWEISLDQFQDEDVLLEIYNSKSGSLVYKNTLNKSIYNVWEGKDNAGQLLGMANFIYVLKSSSKEIQGSITVLR